MNENVNRRIYLKAEVEDVALVPFSLVRGNVSVFNFGVKKSCPSVPMYIYFTEGSML